MTEPVELLLQSPASVALFAALEFDHRADAHPWPPAQADSHPGAMAKAEAWLQSASFPSFLAAALGAADTWAGPWSSYSGTMLPVAYACRRSSLAEISIERFAELLRSPIDLGAQEFWTSRFVLGRTGDRPLDLDQVYCCGEFSIGGRWTTTKPHPRLHDPLITAWELDDGDSDILRRRYPVMAGARIYEIHEPADWARLVSRYPKLPVRAHSGWELPGPNHEGRLRPGPVESASGGHAARSGVRVAMPDWASVARDYDGVHLSWFGMLTCEGHVIDLPELGPDVITMLRYWFSERTLWLNPVFGEPEPLPAPIPRDD